MKVLKMGFVLMTFLLIHVRSANAESQRIQGVNGWLLPVASNVLSSDEAMHIRRGSVNAWDITTPRGATIWPMADGIVQYAGCNNSGGYGCWALIVHDGGFSSIYAHMIEGSVQVVSGQRVHQWTPLGLVGWTGKTSFGPHLHFEIRHTSGRQRIDRYFPLKAMNKCDFCNNDSKSVDNVQSSTRQAIPQRGLTLSANFIRLWILAGLIWATVVAYIIGLNSRLLWFSVGNGSFLALVVVILTSGVWLPKLVHDIPMHVHTPGQGVQQMEEYNPTDAWRIAYAAMRHWEGTKCVHDPVRTFRGITQGTLDSWRRSQGQPTGDVCTMSEQEAEQIYYQNYWVRSGANRMPRGLAITHFDFAVNAGVGRASSAFHACGTNVSCYNNYRENFYRSLKGFSTYGAGWMNRLASIRSLTEGRG